MKSLRTFLLLWTFVLSVLAEEPEYCGLPLKDRRIINGFTAEDFQFPWQVPLFMKSIYEEELSFVCSGTIISSQSILTAAHCVPSNPENLFYLDAYMALRNGSTDLNSGELVELFEYTVHPYYAFNNDGVFYDLAIIQLAEPLDFNKGVWPICLPDPNKDYVGDRVTLSGWGRTETGMIAQNLQTLNQTVISRKECSRQFNEEFDVDYEAKPSTICAEEPGSSACFGDSGGPLIYLEDRSEPSFYTQIGVTSWVMGECMVGLPNGYASIPNQLYWIFKEMRGQTLPAPGERGSL